MNVTDSNGNIQNHAVMYDGVNMYTDVPITAGHASAIPETPAQMVQLVNSPEALVLIPIPSH